jgi:hypothetical protein
MTMTWGVRIEVDLVLGWPVDRVALHVLGGIAEKGDRHRPTR